MFAARKGELLDATADAPDTPLRVLRDACQSIDQTRPGGRTDPGALGARWWLLDSFDRNGRQYVVAARDIVSNQRPGLSRREAEVVGLVALGHSNKVISYELGLAWATVRVLVHRAARKLGVATRKELERTAVALLKENGPREAGQSAPAVPRSARHDLRTVSSPRPDSTGHPEGGPS